MMDNDVSESTQSPLQETLTHKKTFLLAGVFFLVVILLIGVVLFSSSLRHSSGIAPSSVPVQSSAPTSKPSRIWQIIFSYDTKTQQLIVKTISIKPGTALAAQSENSPYKLLLLDKNKQVLFQTDIHIATQVLYNLYFPTQATPSATDFPQLTTLDSLVNIPYYDNADTIQITKNNSSVLEITPPKQLSFAMPSLVRQAYAGGGTCSNLHIVFESDGYTDMNKFHQDVSTAESTFLSKAPFSTNTNIFDFKTVDNPKSNPIGCNVNGQLNITCLFSSASLTNMQNLVTTNFPTLPMDQTHTKIIVLVDGGPQPIGYGYILGVANAIGGQLGVFQDRLYFQVTSTMEVLGHDVGQLYDRYLYPANSPNGQWGAPGNPPPFLTNCTTNANGESFWKAVGVNKGYQGCTSLFMYAPAPLDCGSGGSTTTVMSAAQCGGQQFDAVEQYWLKNTIIPTYECAPTPTPTPTVIPPTNTPTPQSTPNPNSNPNSNSPTPPSSAPIEPYNCVPDPSCKSGNGTQQLCSLKCTPANPPTNG